MKLFGFLLSNRTKYKARLWYNNSARIRSFIIISIEVLHGCCFSQQHYILNFRHTNNIHYVCYTWRAPWLYSHGFIWIRVYIFRLIKLLIFRNPHSRPPFWSNQTKCRKYLINNSEMSIYSAEKYFWAIVNASEGKYGTFFSDSSAS